jgi:hypothetical protein
MTTYRARLCAKFLAYTTAADDTHKPLRGFCWSPLREACNSSAAVTRTPISPSLRYSIYDGSAHAVMLGMGETFIMTFAVALGFSNTTLGLVAALPVLCATILQVLVFQRPRGRRSKKFFVVRGALVQALLWIPIFLCPVRFRLPAIGLILLLIVYHACGHMISPMWNAWMGDLVPDRTRGEYYGRRNKYRALCELSSFLIAGTILHRAASENIFVGFGIIFFVACLMRLLSSWYISRMDEPTTVHELSPRFTLIQFYRRSGRNNFGRFTLLLGAFLCATNIASPFFTAYMLRSLRFSYLELTCALSCSLIFQFLSFQNWGHIGDRFGNLRILKITAVLASMIPLLWLTTDNFFWILFFQAIAGLTWSGLNLSAINYIFDAVQRSNIARCISYYNCTANVGTAVGASIGAAVVGTVWGVADSSAQPLLLLGDPYLPLFLVSSVCRGLIAGLLIMIVREVRRIEPHTTWEALRHFIGLSLTPEFGSRFIDVFLRKKR